MTAIDAAASRPPTTTSAGPSSTPNPLPCVEIELASDPLRSRMVRGLDCLNLPAPTTLPRSLPQPRLAWFFRISSELLRRSGAPPPPPGPPPDSDDDGGDDADAAKLAASRARRHQRRSKRASHYAAERAALDEAARLKAENDALEEQAAQAKMIRLELQSNEGNEGAAAELRLIKKKRAAAAEIAALKAKIAEKKAAEKAKEPSIERVRRNTVVSSAVAHASPGSRAARYKERAARFYRRYAREKLRTLDKQLTEWRCPDDAMMRKMARIVWVPHASLPLLQFYFRAIADFCSI